MQSSACRKQGFIELKERDRWAEEGILQKGGKYFYSREGSTLVAFTVGAEFEPGERAHSAAFSILMELSSFGIRLASKHTGARL